jgi:hypothetical protein
VSSECEIELQETFDCEIWGIVLDAVSLDAVNTIVCGRNAPVSSEGWRFYLACLNEAGEVLWELDYVGNGFSFPNAGVDRGTNGDIWACAPLGYARSFDVLRFETTEHTDIPTSSPRNFTLSVFPNPFNPTTSFRFSLPSSSRINLSVYDIQGRLIKEISDEVFDVGDHAITFDGTTMPTGIYFARLQAGDFVRTRKMVLLK